jgi:hypothetical protein
LKEWDPTAVEIIPAGDTTRIIKFPVSAMYKVPSSKAYNIFGPESFAEEAGPTLPVDPLLVLHK